MSFSVYLLFFFFFKQKTAYEMRISDGSSDVCSSDLFAESGRDWRRFFDAASRLAALGAEQRKIKLQQIKARASVRVSAYSLKRSNDHVKNADHCCAPEPKLRVMPPSY